MVNEAGEGGTEGEVVDLAECIGAQVAGAVDDEEARRAAQAVARHGDGGGFAGCVGVDPDGKGDSVFVEECLEGHGRHGIVVLEDRVEAEQGEVVTEGLLDALGLGGCRGKRSLGTASERLR